MDAPETRDFFTHWWKPGLLTQMLYAAHERERNVVPDPDRVAALFETYQLHGMAKMTRYIENNPSICVIGSSTISLNPDDPTEMNMEKFMELHEFHLGVAHLDLKPMQHLYHLASMLNDLPDEVKTLLDRVFNALASMADGPILKSFPEKLEPVDVRDIVKALPKKSH